jgi:putative PIN family toxin of toxin-antitoxin system
MRFVPDTSVLVSALRSDRGASFRLLRLAADRRFEMLATPALFLEYEDVLSRVEQRSAHGMSLGEVHAMLEVLAQLVVPVEVRFQWRPQLLDADDEMVLEAAMNGHANCIVTHNARHFAGVERRLGMRVLSPRDALKEVER